ncbi:DUF1932 domain-containing protein [Roseomonas sp. BN140053]|uniref:NAD(P)-dependent oxidoreductase n=1 Tax=Roseomonas sp. BN140053 TaxID=3391898 RepID=UPI0039EA1D5A
MLTVAIMAQGAMGAGVARRLTGHSVAVVTCLDGRSPASAARATAAGMQAVAFDALASADLFLSVLPPSEALSIAERVAPLLRPGMVYADCNAISPALAERIGTMLAPSGCAYVDAGIIGGPPREDSYTPRIYASGPHAGRLAVLEAHGLQVPVLDGPIGAASALKMCYAGITKGLTAIGSAMLLAAERSGAGEALHAELADSQPALLAWLGRSVPGMFDKAYRWVGEMDEIAAFVGPEHGEGDIYRGAAQLYARLAADHAGAGAEIGALRAALTPRRRD